MRLNGNYKFGNLNAKLYCDLDLGDTLLVHLLKVQGAQLQVGTKHEHIGHFMLAILAQQDSVNARQSPLICGVLSMLSVVLLPLLLRTLLVFCPYMFFC